jgi:hypothetical protein
MSRRNFHELTSFKSTHASACLARLFLLFGVRGRFGNWGHVAGEQRAQPDVATDKGVQFGVREDPINTQDRCRPRTACRRRHVATNRAGYRGTLIANHEHVMPRRRRNANCRALSITCGRALSKMG